MLVQAATPHPFAVNSYFSASIMAEIIYNKFVLALPLYRQAQNWLALIPLSSKAMADQVIKNAEAFEHSKAAKAVEKLGESLSH